MTDKQPEALQLANALEFAGRYATETEKVAAERRIERNKKAAAELRRLHEVNAELVEALRCVLENYVDDDCYGEPAEQARFAIAKATGEQQ